MEIDIQFNYVIIIFRVQVLFARKVLKSEIQLRMHVFIPRVWSWLIFKYIVATYESLWIVVIRLFETENIHLDLCKRFMRLVAKLKSLEFFRMFIFFLQKTLSAIHNVAFLAVQSYSLLYNIEKEGDNPKNLCERFVRAKFSVSMRFT